VISYPYFIYLFFLLHKKTGATATAESSKKREKEFRHPSTDILIASTVKASFRLLYILIPILGQSYTFIPTFA
jgi:hypothetical protein